ncbi:MAG: HAD family hydrolase [Rickettsiales bacterium]|jgi:HAD superfamily hydrolase (TIGR01509 family)|nr:HAD family hydrolase [Rickettsiales bacterium]
MKNLYIFDFDGTIADTKTIVKRGIIEYSKNNSLPTPNVDLVCYGYSNPDLYDFGWNVEKDKQREIMDKAFIFITNKIKNMEYVPNLFDKTKETIEKLYNDGNTLAICTSREKNSTMQILKHYDLEKYFTTFKTRDDVKLRNKNPKPAPDLILEILEELNFDKNNSYIIGDTDADIDGGKNAGIKTIGVSWGYYTKEDMEKTKPGHIIDSFEELIGI